MHGCNILVSGYPAGDLNSLFIQKNLSAGWQFAFLSELDRKVSSVQKVAHMASFSVLTAHTWALNIPYIVFSQRRLSSFARRAPFGALVNLSFAALAQFPMKG